MKNRDLIFTLFWSVLTSSLLVLTSILLAYGSNEGLAIDEETAAKLAMVASYSFDFGQAPGFYVRTCSETPRTFIDALELYSLDGKEKYYAVTLYQGEGQYKKIEEFSEGIALWLDIAATFFTRTGDNTYDWAPAPPEGFSMWFHIYPKADEYRDYYSCIVPTTTTQGFMSYFHIGIAAYIYMQELACRLLAFHLGVEINEVELIRTTPDYDFVCQVSGKEYIVHMPLNPDVLKVEIISGDELSMAIERGYVSAEKSVVFYADKKAVEEDINVWWGYVHKIEENSGFGPGPSVTADAVNAVLQDSGIKTLKDEAAKNKGTIIGPSPIPELQNEEQ